MALYEICFKHTEIYYEYENIEAESKEQAEEIARKLLDSIDFQEDLMERAHYDDHEDEFIRAYESHASRGFKPLATLTADEIASYIE